jgi:hypothetical protein
VGEQMDGDLSVSRFSPCIGKRKRIRSWCHGRTYRQTGAGSGVPVLQSSNVNQASAPWLEEGSGMRRQLADDGVWCG